MQITELMTDDHHACDDVFANLERLVQTGDWSKTQQEAADFIRLMERHFGVEENILFPAIENATGMTMGPTEVMRMEHVQMRQLFEELKESIEAADAESVLGVTETILVMMQQHNAKEESVLYTLADHTLGEASPEMVEGIAA
ncbi:MAG: hemerythrin domain-containing protein [Halieaceae bacterium]|nr:hemerythrin domain-containing protein [Halieaceae bacterium]